IASVCDRLAGAGWLAVAPHLFHRTGDPVIDYGDSARIGEHMGPLAAAEVLEDLDVALARVRSVGIGPARTGVVGFCMGGSVALVLGARRELGAAVTFYGGGIREGRFGFGPLVDEARALRSPWLGLFGDLDAHIPVEEVEALRAAAGTAGVPSAVVRYPDAGHGFNCDARDSYHEASARDAWSRALDWFSTHLSG
ncbi:MAG: dienelactone hydrolase family protein, partial [Acidimicrobiia bacterium]